MRKLLEPVITGFNTDIEHDGVVYHVQTEDKGLDSPIILSLVYSGGTILASKRSPYEDLIAQGFSDEALAERLKRQHRLICAAIHSGRINDLKKMSGRAKAPAAPALPKSVAAAEPVETVDVVEEVEEAAPAAPVEQPFEIEYWPMTQEWTPPPPPSPASEGNVNEEPEPLAAEELSRDETAPLELPREIQPDGLAIVLLDDEQFYSGEKYTLRVHISSWLAGEEKSLANAGVSIKILGTTFRPLIFTVKTEDDGVATVATEIPHFTSGRAAVLIRATVKDEAAELRRIIHPAR
ncbi:MAG TPA: hypothetical protein VJT15_02340 [Pyrinomonadaceae bacterium]|nr:hypothetical protein [Pyrinomonadaceae bacterium]